MIRPKVPVQLTAILIVLTAFLLPSASSAQQEAPSAASAAPSEEINKYSAFIEGYVNQNWKKDSPPYRVLLLEITKRERIDVLNGQFNYCFVALESGREIRECVACFWQPDMPANPEKPFEFKGIFEMGRKLTL